MIHLKITPDSRLDNMNVEQLAQTLCLYQSPYERWNGKRLDRHPFMSFETILKRGATYFVVTVQDNMETLARKAIETAWPKASIESIPDPLTYSPALISTLELQYHYMFAIKVDRREITHLASILENLNIMQEQDMIYIQSLTVPANKDWYLGAVTAYDQFKKGVMPQKFHFNRQGIANTFLKVAASVVFGTIGIVTELITGEEPKKINLNEGERAVILRDGPLKSETMQKVKGDAFNTSVYIGVVSPDPKRAKALMRMITMAFRELDGDNHFVSHTVDTVKGFKRMKSRAMALKIQGDYLSIPEVSRLFLLPTGPLQERYHIPNIKTLEVEVPDGITQVGIRIGQHEHKGKLQDVFQPTGNHDELCLPHVVIGGMGQGKTKGFAANWMVEAVRNDFGALAIDPAKGEIGNEIERVLPSEKVIRIKLGQIPIALDWCEVKYSPKAKNRLANIILSFFNSAADEAGAQTARYIRAAVMGMQTSKLSEIVRILEDDEYREEVIDTMPGRMYRSTLESLHPKTMSPSRKAQILSPIYNRLDTILGDEYLMECMESDQSLDMVELMSQRKAIIIDVPKRELGPEGVDLIVNLLSTKIDLSMTLREDEKQFPFFVVFDEPHQFLRSARTWKSAAVESRKWRVGYIWMFHSWEQLPRDLGEIIKAAGPHYHLYPSSKKTFKELSEEIAPFTLEDALKLKSHHAINVIRAGGEVVKPFIAKMAIPPSEQIKAIS